MRNNIANLKRYNMHTGSDDDMLHPGEVLVNELDGRGEEVTAFAIKIGMFPSDFIDLLNGRQPVTEDIAAILERELNIPASFWLSLQRDYDAQIAERTGK